MPKPKSDLKTIKTHLKKHPHDKVVVEEGKYFKNTYSHSHASRDPVNEAGEDIHFVVDGVGEVRLMHDEWTFTDHLKYEDADTPRAVFDELYRALNITEEPKEVKLSDLASPDTDDLPF